MQDYRTSNAFVNNVNCSHISFLYTLLEILSRFNETECGNGSGICQSLFMKIHDEEKFIAEQILPVNIKQL